MTKDLTFTSLETITAFDISSGNYLFTLDELQKATISQSQEATEVTGRGGRKLNSLKKNKAIKISGTNGLVSNGLMEMQTGGKFEEKATEVMWADYLTVNSQAATTTYKAVGTTGAEIVGMYVKGADGQAIKTLSQGAEVSSGVFTYAPESKALAFHTDVDDGTEIVVYYKRKIQADVMDNSSTEYSKKCMLYVDALAEDDCSNVFRVQIFIPRADFSGEFSMDFGDSQTVHAFEAEGLTGSCGGGSNLWTYIVFGADAADAD